MIKDNDRIDSLRQVLKENFLEALILFHPENILLSTGILPWAPYTLSVVTKENIIIISPWWVEEICWKRSWADEVFIFDWLKSLQVINPEEAIVSILKKITEKYNIKSIGYDSDMAHYMPNVSPSSFFSYKSLKSLVVSNFDKCKDIAGTLEKLRTIKTDYEKEKLRIANKLSKAIVNSFYKYTIPGAREVDVASEIVKSCQMMVGQNGIDFTYCDPPQITSGVERTWKAFSLTNPATDRKIKKGEPVMLELGGCADGYWFDITRTVIAGNSKNFLLEDMWKAIDKAATQAISSYIPGKSSGDSLWQTAYAVLIDSGFKEGIVHGLGHGLGFAYHESMPGIGPGAKNIIYPNMVTSLEPGIYLKGKGGVRIEQNVIWGKEKGEAEILTDSSYTLRRR